MQWTRECLGHSHVVELVTNVKSKSTWSVIESYWKISVGSKGRIRRLKLQSLNYMQFGHLKRIVFRFSLDGNERDGAKLCTRAQTTI